MILYNDKRFITNSAYPDTDWVGDADYILNDNDEKDKALEEKIIGLYPNFEFVFDDDGGLVDVAETEPQPIPEKPPEPPTNAELAAAIAELAEVICGG